MQYEAPRIIRRGRIDALLAVTSNGDTATLSDVNRKENVVAVVW